jgi:hypothetical protein
MENPIWAGLISWSPMHAPEQLGSEAFAEKPPAPVLPWKKGETMADTLPYPDWE